MLKYTCRDFNVSFLVYFRLHCQIQKSEQRFSNFNLMVMKERLAWMLTYYIRGCFFFDYPNM